MPRTRVALVGLVGATTFALAFAAVSIVRGSDLPQAFLAAVAGAAAFAAADVLVFSIWTRRSHR